jgi:hypothetical protein
MKPQVVKEPVCREVAKLAVTMFAARLRDGGGQHLQLVGTTVHQGWRSGSRNRRSDQKPRRGILTLRKERLLKKATD